MSVGVRPYISPLLSVCLCVCLCVSVCLSLSACVRLFLTWTLHCRLSRRIQKQRQKRRQKQTQTHNQKPKQKHIHKQKCLGSKGRGFRRRTLCALQRRYNLVLKLTRACFQIYVYVVVQCALGGKGVKIYNPFAFGRMQYPQRWRSLNRVQNASCKRTRARLFAVD